LDEPPAALPLPRRVAWFAPWRRRKRWLVLIAVTMLAGYVLAEEPLGYLIDRRYGRHSAETYVWHAHFTIYRPMNFLREHSKLLQVFETSQFVWLTKTFGSAFEPCFD
jgi:hypothetical protein